MNVFLSLLSLPLVHCLSHVQPEVLVVVDSSLHTTLGGDIITTTEYVRQFWSAVNLRFQSLSSPSVELVVVGMEIGSTPYLQGQKFDAGDALDKMGKYYFTKERNSWDLVVTLTGRDLCRRKGGSCRLSTAGYAYVGGACVVNSRRSKVNAVALVEDDGGFGGVVVAAHEVAHLLGAAHDGDAAPGYLAGPGAKGCPWSDGYIMSDRRRGVRGLAWSACTQAQLRHFISSPTGACLKTRASPAALSLLPTASSLAPLVPSPDLQCQREVGPGSRACYTDTKLCTQLFCLQPKTKTCIAYRPAVEGSTCGASGHCSAGACVSQGKTTPRIDRVDSSNKKIEKHSVEKERKRKTANRRNFRTTTIMKITKTWPKTAKATTFVKPKFLRLTYTCVDESIINFRGIRNCDKLFRSFAFMACDNKVIEKQCCGSHALYC